MKTFIHHKIGKKPRKFMKVMFMLLGFFGLMVLTTIRSDIYAAGTSNQGIFLDQSFWNSNPTDSQIIQALYGGNSIYINSWGGNPCNVSNMQVDYFTSLPQTLLSNKIYVLNTGAINISATKSIPSCTAIVSKVDGGTTVYSSTGLDGMFMVADDGYGIIIDNVNFNGYKMLNNAGQVHNPSVCVKLLGEREIQAPTYKVSINNGTFYKCDVGVYVGRSTSFSNSTRYVSLTNLRFLGANDNGIKISPSALGISLFNIMGVQAGLGVEGDYVVVNDSIFNRDGDSVINITSDASNVVLNNVISDVGNSSTSCTVNNLYGDVLGQSYCTVYGIHYIFPRNTSTCPAESVTYAQSSNNLGWSAGSQYYSLCYDWDFIINPVSRNSVDPLLLWNSPLTHVTQGCNGGNLNCRNVTPEQIVDNDISNYRFSFGKNIPTQIQPVRWIDGTLANWSVGHSSSYFIGSNLKKVVATSTLPSVVTGSTALTVNSNDGLISKYNVLGPHITSPKYNITKGVNTTVNWTNGDGSKIAIFQVTGASYYAMHFMGVTERSSNGPTFTLNGTQVYECASKTWTGFSNYSNTNLHSSPFGHQFPSGSLAWSNSPSLTYTAGGVVGSYTFTGQMRYANGATSTRTATITVNNSIPTANNFTGSSNVQCTAQTVNWKTLSNAQEGACGNGSLTATVQSQGSKGACNISSNNIIYTPNNGSQGTDHCTIRIKDNENSTKDIIVYRGGINCGGGGTVYGTVSINNGAVATNNATTTLNLTYSSTATKMKFSCNNSTWSAWKNTASTYSRNIINGSGCTNSQGTKTVYAQFSGGGVSSSIVSDTIIYDTAKPTVSVSLNSAGGTVTISDTTSGLSGNQLLYYLWQTSSSCPTSISSYNSRTIGDVAGDTTKTVNISANGLNGTYYLCIYSGVYDRAGNASTGTRSSSGYTYSNSSAGCTWTTQPTLNPIGPNNQDQVGTGILTCNLPHTEYKLKLGYVSSYVINFKGSLFNLFDYVTGQNYGYPINTLTVRYSLTNDIISFIQDIAPTLEAGSYPLVVTGNIALSIGPSDPIQFDYSAPKSLVTDPSQSTVTGNFTVTVEDVDVGPAGLLTCYYATGGTLMGQERDCNGTVDIIYENDCRNGICDVYVRSEDTVGNVGGKERKTYTIEYDAPTVGQAEPYAGNFCQRDNQYYGKGTLSFRADYNGDGVSLCQYKMNSNNWAAGTKDSVYCYKNSLSISANTTINFRAYNGKYGTGTAVTVTYDNTKPVLQGKTDFGTGWYTSAQTSIFTFSDAGAGISGDDRVSCQISTQGSGVTCTTTPNVCDCVGNCFTTSQTSNSVNIDWTAPTATLSKNISQCTNQNVIVTVNAIDNISGPGEYFYTFNGDTQNSYSNTFIVPENGTLSVVVKDKAGNPSSSYSTEILNIDKIQPTIANVTDAVGYECQNIVGSITVTDDGCGSGEKTYAWGGSETYGSNNSYTLYSDGTGEFDTGVTVKDGAGNVTSASVNFHWNDAVLNVPNTPKNLGTITSSKTISNVVSDMGATAGSCETITPTLVSCSLATGTLNGNQLVITVDNGVSNQSGNCILSFTDGDTTKAAVYNFTVNTPKPVISVTGPSSSPACSSSRTVSATATNTPTTFQYVVTTSSTCDSTTSFSSATTYTPGQNISFTSESDNNKYVCFRAANAYGTGYARSDKITGIDKSGPNKLTNLNKTENKPHGWTCGSHNLFILSTI